MDIPSRGEEILLVASCYRNRDKLQPDEPLGSYADLTLFLNILTTLISSGVLFHKNLALHLKDKR